MKIGMDVQFASSSSINNPDVTVRVESSTLSCGCHIIIREPIFLQIIVCTQIFM